MRFELRHCGTNSITMSRSLEMSKRNRVSRNLKQIKKNTKTELELIAHVFPLCVSEYVKKMHPIISKKKKPFSNVEFK